MAQEDWQQVLAWVKQALMSHVRLAILARAVAGWAPSGADAAGIYRALQGRIDVEDDGSELAERYRRIHNSLPLEGSAALADDIRNLIEVARSRALWKKPHFYYSTDSSLRWSDLSRASKRSLLDSRLRSAPRSDRV